MSDTSAREKRAIARGFLKREREFNERERDLDAEAERRQRLGLPGIEQSVGPAERREKAMSNIRNEHNIGHFISEYLPTARDRSNLVPDHTRHGFLTYRENRDTICLPGGNTFRTNPDAGIGCGPFASRDALDCCVQTDLDFCANVAAVMRETNFHPYSTTEPEWRLLYEMHDWMYAHHLDLLPPTKEVTVNTSDNDGLQVLKLATRVGSSATLNIVVNEANHDLDVGITNLEGIVCVRAGANGASVSFASVERIVTGDNHIRSCKKLFVHCPIEVFNLNDVVGMINSEPRELRSMYELQLPFAIPVTAVGQGLLQTPLSNTPWVARAEQHDGPIWKHAHNFPWSQTRYEELKTSYDIERNRISVSYDYIEIPPS
jgi:hypothetical protein